MPRLTCLSITQHSIPLSKRAPSGYTSKITQAVINLLGGPAEISTLVKHYVENDLSNDGLESGKIAESIALTVKDAANKYKPSTVRVVPTPNVYKSLALKQDCKMSERLYGYARKHFPDLLPALNQLQKVLVNIKVDTVPLRMVGKVIGHAVKDPIKDVFMPQLRSYLRAGGTLRNLNYKWGGDGFSIIMFHNIRVPCEQVLSVDGSS